MRTAVIYARFSCSKQREASIEDQLRVCREWCDREGYEVVAEYCDQAMSGRTDSRPQFQLMIANAGESDIVLVYMMDRFSRDIYDAPIYKKMLRDKGVKVVSATEAMPDGPEAMLMENMYEAMAAMESAKIGLRSKRGMEGNALKCLYNGDRIFGYGVDPDTKRYTIDEDQAPIVRDCFARRAKGESVNAIAKAMAAKGVRTYRGKPCSHTMVDNILKNKRYLGIYKWGEIEEPGGMPAIITQEEWDMAHNAPQKKARKAEQWDDYAFTGKAVCGGCAHNMVGTSARSKGKKYSYYSCGKKCGNVKSVPKAWLENHVAEALRWIVSDRDLAVQIGKVIEEYQRSSSADADRLRLEGVVRDADAALANITKAIEQGIITPGLKERIDELQDQKEQAQLSLARMEAYRFDAELFADFLQYSSTLTDEKLIDMLVWQIVVSNEEIIVTLNYDVEPGIPQRFTLDGFAQFDGVVKEKCETADDERFRTISMWLPKYETLRNKTGYVLAIQFGRISLVLKRAS